MTKGGLTGKVVFKCSDGRPLLAFIGEGVPKWATGALDLEGLKASAEVVFSDPRTTVRNLKAMGEKIHVEGDFDRRGEDSSGAFYIESGILRIAVEMKGQKTIVHPLFPRTWFDKQRAVESRGRATRIPEEGLAHARILKIRFDSFLFWRDSMRHRILASALARLRLRARSASRPRPGDRRFRRSTLWRSRR